MTHSEHINPAMLSWARETAGLSVERAAEKLGLKDSARATAADKLRAIETGDGRVSEGLLDKAASAYRRPLVAFYLAEPPPRGERGEDFRASAGSVSAQDNAALDALVRDVRARQQMLRDVLLDDEGAAILPFVASVQLTVGSVAGAQLIRAAMGVSEAQQRQAKDAAGLFRLVRAAAERIGVYVLLLGDMGSHHSDIGPDVFRGFAIADDVAPFVVINDNDAATARSFTLIHELAHIWIGASGVSGPLRGLSENAIERFCNGVAGAFLLPDHAVSDGRMFAGRDVTALLAVTEQIARTWNVSQAVVTYRAASMEWITAEMAATLFRMFADRWRAERQRARDDREPDESGPSFYVVRRSRLGAGLLDVVRRALQADILTHTKAAKILGVAPYAVEPLLRATPRAA
jgi:Zn-dependent peptidase ImmA (M78 family)/transcriptional regulator with XRE-family HTH domain